MGRSTPVHFWVGDVSSVSLVCLYVKHTCTGSYRSSPKPQAHCTRFHPKPQKNHLVVHKEQRGDSRAVRSWWSFSNSELSAGHHSVLVLSPRRSAPGSCPVSHPFCPSFLPLSPSPRGDAQREDVLGAISVPGTQSFLQVLHSFCVPLTSSLESRMACWLICLTSW